MNERNEQPQHEFEPRGTFALGLIYVTLLIALWSYVFILLLQRR